MPINYPSNFSWIRGADPAANYGKGFGLGLQAGHAQAQIAMESARLAEAQNRTAVEIALQQQKLERQGMVDQQKLEVAKAYHEQQGALKAQELEMKQQALQEKIKQAAAQSLAMERFRADIASGKDPMMAALGLAGIPNTGAAVSGAIKGLAERNEPSKNVMPVKYTLNIGGEDVDFAVNPKTGHFEQHKKDKLPVVNPDRATSTLNTLLNVSPDMLARRGLDTNVLGSLQKVALDRANAALRGTQGTSATVAPQEEVLPFPKSKDDAVKGKKYQTVWGVSEWTGTGWRPLNPVTSEPAAAPQEEQYDTSDDLE